MLGNPGIRDQKAAGSNLATSTPGSVDFPTLPGFAFWQICRFFPVYNLPGCSGSLRHPAADLKTSLPRISVNFRFFPRRKCLI